MFCLTVTYPMGEDTMFDFDYYLDSHIPLCERVFAEYGFRGAVLRTNQGKGPGSGDLNYASVDLVFESIEQLQAALGAGGKGVTADVANYTNVRPQMSFGEIRLIMR